MEPQNRRSRQGNDPSERNGPPSVVPPEEDLNHEQPVSPQRHDPYAAFRVDNYVLYSFGWIFALVGTQIQGVAIAWEVYQRTGEALALGIVGLLQALPTILLALPAGY